MKTYDIVVCGGTFDLLHAGHKYFLQQVFDHCEKLIIGLTSDKYIQENKPNLGITSFANRKKNLDSFLKSIGAGERVVVTLIDDLYGPLLDPNFKAEAIAISEHRENVMKINSARKSRGLKPLEVLEVNLWQGEDREKVSSTRIRAGEIDQEGKNLLLPSTLRHLLQDAWGEVLFEIPSNLDSNKLVSVGDVTTGKFIEKGIFPKICIIDNKVERKDKKFEYEFLPEYTKINVENPAGKLTVGLVEAIENAFKKVRTVIEVDGEEDLAVLPALLYAPIGFEVYYGQPGVGLVRIKVNGDVKRKAAELIDKFEYD